jgi:hypothetical protein
MFKLQIKHMRDICFLKFGNTVKTHYDANYDICKVETVYSTSINFSKFGFRFILVTMYNVSSLAVVRLVSYVPCTCAHCDATR